MRVSAVSADLSVPRHRVTSTNVTWNSLSLNCLVLRWSRTRLLECFIERRLKVQIGRELPKRTRDRVVDSLLEAEESLILHLIPVRHLVTLDDAVGLHQRYPVLPELSGDIVRVKQVCGNGGYGHVDTYYFFSAESLSISWMNSGQVETRCADGFPVLARVVK